MRTPEISVVVPVYNGSEYLRETIESLLCQTFENFELIAVDDGSEDQSVDIIQSFKDDRIRLIQKPNGGLCDALNRGIVEARAPYLARNDQDDLSFPDRLRTQKILMDGRPEAIALFAFNTKIGGKRGWSNRDKLNMVPGQIRDYQPLQDGCLLGSTMLARTEALLALGGFRQNYYPSDDLDLEFRLSQAGEVLVLQEALVAYRFQTGANTYRVFSEMQKKSRWAQDSYSRRLQGSRELSFQEFLQWESTSRWLRFERYLNESAKLHMRVAGQHYLDGRYFSAASRFSAALMLNPNDIFRRARRLLG